ncbi:14501_t:CDS:2 [Funneliformis mosseae]|uniref:14501_t:CDS:1 n=1 Tax=Funneliformis mosseae TaxID=27381 RepID=A0A9N8VGE7_FUNMO|nr:14501_t:CDS:2 [Funneliformis mosseae]
MVKVLVLGATGFIGFAVAQALARSGHETYGLYRKREKEKELAKNEIFPILGDTNDVSTWNVVAEQVDIIIDATSEYNDPTKHVTNILDTLEEINMKRIKSFEPKLTFIYTSGLWIYGGDSYNVNCESTPLKTNLKLDQWRPAIEQMIIKSQGIIIRPGAAYGKNGSLTAQWFESAIKGELYGIGSKDVRWNLVHVDDLADAYVRSVERSELVKGQIFIITNNQSESMGDMLDAVARITEYKGLVKYKVPTTEFEIAMAHTGIFSNKKAQTILDWKQRQLSFVDGIYTWWNSYKAYI